MKLTGKSQSFNYLKANHEEANTKCTVTSAISKASELEEIIHFPTQIVPKKSLLKKALTAKSIETNTPHDRTERYSKSQIISLETSPRMCKANRLQCDTVEVQVGMTSNSPLAALFISQTTGQSTSSSKTPILKEKTNSVSLVLERKYRPIKVENDLLLRKTKSSFLSPNDSKKNQHNKENNTARAKKQINLFQPKVKTISTKPVTSRTRVGETNTEDESSTTLSTKLREARAALDGTLLDATLEQKEKNRLAKQTELCSKEETPSKNSLINRIMTKIGINLQPKLRSEKKDVSKRKPKAFVNTISQSTKSIKADVLKLNVTKSLVDSAKMFTENVVSSIVSSDREPKSYFKNQTSDEAWLSLNYTTTEKQTIRTSDTSYFFSKSSGNTLSTVSRIMSTDDGRYSVYSNDNWTQVSNSHLNKTSEDKLIWSDNKINDFTVTSSSFNVSCFNKSREDTDSIKIKSKRNDYMVYDAMGIPQYLNLANVNEPKCLDKDSVIVISHLNKKHNLEEIINNLLVNVDISQVSSIFVVVPSSDDTEIEPSTKAAKLAVCLSLSETNNDIWNPTTPDDLAMKDDCYVLSGVGTLHISRSNVFSSQQNSSVMESSLPLMVSKQTKPNYMNEFEDNSNLVLDHGTGLFKKKIACDKGNEESGTTLREVFKINESRSSTLGASQSETFLATRKQYTAVDVNSFIEPTIDFNQEPEIKHPVNTTPKMTSANDIIVIREDLVPANRSNGPGKRVPRRKPLNTRSIGCGGKVKREKNLSEDVKILLSSLPDYAVASCKDTKKNTRSEKKKPSFEPPQGKAKLIIIDSFSSCTLTENASPNISQHNSLKYDQLKDKNISIKNYFKYVSSNSSSLEKTKQHLRKKLLRDIFKKIEAKNKIKIPLENDCCENRLQQEQEPHGNRTCQDPENCLEQQNLPTMSQSHNALLTSVSQQSFLKIICPDSPEHDFSELVFPEPNSPNRFSFQRNPLSSNKTPPKRVSSPHSSLRSYCSRKSSHNKGRPCKRVCTCCSAELKEQIRLIADRLRYKTITDHKIHSLEKLLAPLTKTMKMITLKNCHQSSKSKGTLTKNTRTTKNKLCQMTSTSKRKFKKQKAATTDTTCDKPCLCFTVQAHQREKFFVVAISEVITVVLRPRNHRDGNHVFSSESPNILSNKQINDLSVSCCRIPNCKVCYRGDFQDRNIIKDKDIYDSFHKHKNCQSSELHWENSNGYSSSDHSILRFKWYNKSADQRQNSPSDIDMQSTINFLKTPKLDKSIDNINKPRSELCDTLDQRYISKGRSKKEGIAQTDSISRSKRCGPNLYQPSSVLNFGEMFGITMNSDRMSKSGCFGSLADIYQYGSSHAEQTQLATSSNFYIIDLWKDCKNILKKGKRKKNGCKKLKQSSTKGADYLKQNPTRANKCCQSKVFQTEKTTNTKKCSSTNWSQRTYGEQYSEGSQIKSINNTAMSPNRNSCNNGKSERNGRKKVESYKNNVESKKPKDHCLSNSVMSFFRRVSNKSIQSKKSSTSESSEYSTGDKRFHIERIDYRTEEESSDGKRQHYSNHLPKRNEANKKRYIWDPSDNNMSDTNRTDFIGDEDSSDKKSQYSSINLFKKNKSKKKHACKKSDTPSELSSIALSSATPYRSRTKRKRSSCLLKEEMERLVKFLVPPKKDLPILKLSSSIIFFSLK